jgi:hypothetical protein
MRITNQFTVRHRQPKSDTERSIRQFAASLGYTFNSINWKKRVAHFTTGTGAPYAVTL